MSDLHMPNSPTFAHKTTNSKSSKRTSASDLKSLSNENEKILRQIQKNEFNQTESALIILSFEKNLEQKTELLKKKAEELQKVESEAQELNNQLAKTLEELVRIDEQITSKKGEYSNMISDLERVELSLAKKSQELNAATADINSVERRFEDKKIELGKIEARLRDEEERSLLANGHDERVPERLSTIEKAVKDKIVKRVQDEMTRHFQDIRKKALTTQQLGE